MVIFVVIHFIVDFSVKVHIKQYVNSCLSRPVSVFLNVTSCFWKLLNECGFVRLCRWGFQSGSEYNKSGHQYLQSGYKCDDVR